MSFSSHVRSLYRHCRDRFYLIPELPRNIMVTVLLLCGAYYISSILISHTGGENNSALVFVLAVTIISFLTTGYLYGILASVVMLGAVGEKDVRDARLLDMTTLALLDTHYMQRGIKGSHVLRHEEVIGFLFPAIGSAERIPMTGALRRT